VQKSIFRDAYNNFRRCRDESSEMQKNLREKKIMFHAQISRIPLSLEHL
jgi:hypothetical protein